MKNEVTLFNREQMELMKYLDPDKDGMSSLNGLWEYAGRPEYKDPRRWTETEQAKAHIESTCKIFNAAKNDIIKTKKGKGGGTRGVPQIVLEYAKYLDSDLAVFVNEVFFQRVREEKNPDLIGDRYIESYRKQGKSDQWIKARLDGKIARKAFTNHLSAHGVKTGTGFSNCTNAIYRPLYGGGADLVREKKGLVKADSIRDNMTSLELAATRFSEELAMDNIDRKNIHGEKSCEIECENSSKVIARAIVESRQSNSAF